jgi:hypothetical protein
VDCKQGELLRWLHNMYFAVCAPYTQAEFIRTCFLSHKFWALIYSRAPGQSIILSGFILCQQFSDMQMLRYGE